MIILWESEFAQEIKYFSKILGHLKAVVEAFKDISTVFRTTLVLYDDGFGLSPGSLVLHVHHLGIILDLFELVFLANLSKESLKAWLDGHHFLIMGHLHASPKFFNLKLIWLFNLLFLIHPVPSFVVKLLL